MPIKRGIHKKKVRSDSEDKSSLTNPPSQSTLPYLKTRLRLRKRTTSLKKTKKPKTNTWCEKRAKTNGFTHPLFLSISPAEEIKKCIASIEGASEGNFMFRVAVGQEKARRNASKSHSFAHFQKAIIIAAP